MNRAIAIPQTSCGIFANVSFGTSTQGQIRPNTSRQTWQKVGLPERRSCDIYPFALCCAWANTVKWLK